MSATPQQKLGQGGSDTWVAFFGGGFAAHVDLLPDEVALHAWDVALSRSWWSTVWGTLYLTNRRLVWIRWRFAVPWLPKTIAVNLESVSATGVERRLRVALQRGLAVSLNDGSELLFWPPTYGARPKEIASVISEAVRERGLLG